MAPPPFMERAVSSVASEAGTSLGSAESVRNALADTIQQLPEHLWKSLTWDPGKASGILESRRVWPMVQA
jgi:IS30 family transposase